MALLLLFCCNQWLIKEPVNFQFDIQGNQVLYKSQVSKTEECTHLLEDELPSRIDFGKSKYGGPFTTEKVEYVKTFLRLIPMAVIGGALAGVHVVLVFRNQLNKIFVKYSDSLSPVQTSGSVINCYI